MTIPVEPITRADMIRLERKLDVLHRQSHQYQASLQRWMELLDEAEKQRKAILNRPQR